MACEMVAKMVDLWGGERWLEPVGWIHNERVISLAYLMVERMVVLKVVLKVVLLAVL